MIFPLLPLKNLHISLSVVDAKIVVPVGLYLSSPLDSFREE